MTATFYAPHGMVCSADQLASSAGVAALRAGGSAVDAAIATNAVMAVTAPHQCGLGGDLFALVHVDGAAPQALNASGRAGTGADPQAMRDDGHDTMPLYHDIRTVTVPGCVDGWLALHQRYGRLPLAGLFDIAIDYADNGFGASPLLASSVSLVAGTPGAGDLLAATAAGARVRRPGVARTLRGIAELGREGFYQGEFGAGLLELGHGEFTAEDLAAPHADWAEPLSVNAFGHRIWTVPPNSQGYVALLALAITQRLDLPPDPEDPQWAHLMVEAARQAGHDRPDQLYEAADVTALLDDTEVSSRAAAVEPAGRSTVANSADAGDTTYLCAVDAEGMAVSLIQSNASGFGARIFEPATGIGLHNRGLGFNLIADHPAEYGAGRRPPHTLAPLLVTRLDGRLRAVAGTMGGDTQPQILQQVLTRLLHHGATPADAIGAPRWRLGNSTGFDTWSSSTGVVELEARAPSSWDGISERGHQVSRVAAGFGHAHLIEIGADGIRGGAADPRAMIGAAVGC
jgi:gamma-glutamyltranspeptidase/glutathione hydrolase